ncbi:MAG: hypothetical protein WCD79_11890 [Chthoniobacteraceae bacterium]
MSTPIPLNLPPRDPRRELEVRLQNAPMQHAEAILDGYEVIQQLHESGAFNILRGLLGERDKVIEQTVHAVNTPEMIRGMRNLTVLVTALGKIDPAVLGTITGAVAQTLADSPEKTEKPPGLWDLFKKSRSENFRRGLAFSTTFIEKLGGSLFTERNKHNEQQK